MEIKRSIYQRIAEQCFKGKAIFLLGARQVGKTTLLKSLQKELDVPSNWLNADEADILQEFTNATTSTRLLQLIGANNKLVIIDEAQQIPDIGKKLKLIHDTYPEIQIIATGSSAFDLQNEANESMTGRKREFHLYPFSFNELAADKSVLEEKRLLNTRLIYGSYPEIVMNPGNEREALLEIANSYLYKDLLQYDGIRKASAIEKLLQALAFQVGSEVSYNELAKTVGNINTTTVEKYLDLLEKAYVIYKLPALSRNHRNEIKKGKKYYFYDNGIRNVLISNYNPIELRQDKGALWENYLITERLKQVHYQPCYCNRYFWRTLDQAEIDYVEESNGVMNAYEIKWKSEKVRFPASFLNAYPDNSTKLVNLDNYESFIQDCSV
ncbi:MAG: putative AAA+ superfamily ATPase [Spirosomataceae bacterium]|jgi:predicted AAA+ superfamily ATPase